MAIFDVTTLEMLVLWFLPSFRDSSWFNETWLGRIKEESGANWRLKVLRQAPSFSRSQAQPVSGVAYNCCKLFIQKCLQMDILLLFPQVSNLKKILQSMLEYYHDVSMF